MSTNAEKRRPDYLAELYVAGVLADAGWNVYFPHRDEGFDFIISKYLGDRIVLRPVQVKGKYPTKDKTDKAAYGYMGRLSALHNEMVWLYPIFRVAILLRVPFSQPTCPLALFGRAREDIDVVRPILKLASQRVDGSTLASSTNMGFAC